MLDGYLPSLLRRWNDGCRNARQLWREVAKQGYPHSRSPIERFIGDLKRQEGTSRQWHATTVGDVYTEEDRPRRPLTPVQAARVFLLRPEDRSHWEQNYLTRFLQQDPSLAQTYHHVAAFCQMLRQRQGHQFTAWLDAVAEQGEREVQAFARSLSRDAPAVQAGLTRPGSNGMTEGFIHRLKLLKRQAYGRAGVALLKHRIMTRSGV